MLKQRSIPRETPGRGGERGAKSTIATGFDLPDRQCAHICNRRACEQLQAMPLANRVNPAPPSSRLAWRGKAEMFPLVTFCPKQEDKSHHRTAVREIGCRQPGGTDRRTEAARPWQLAGAGLRCVLLVEGSRFGCGSLNKICFSTVSTEYGGTAYIILY
ncbi:uncharacterized protein CIMG_07309 [Coccidioides immitis RS]|uniref:Uncharacterized protein n=1 Tax=Coccidioides immitis (strain RS) TaxID=246410 RepID=J3KA25_COCIM|nr:uncharacterized protein CIMG_07309 [Coccidioides immitis RS]EAS31830.3 hypothetical protein CIMG_07309 [Coccidioides immitis RS]